MQELEVGLSSKTVSRAGQHRFSVVDPDNLHRWQLLPAAPVENQLEQGSCPTGHFEMLLAEIRTEEAQLLGQRAVVREGEDKEAPDVVPPRLGPVGGGNGLPALRCRRGLHWLILVVDRVFRPWAGLN